MPIYYSGTDWYFFPNQLEKTYNQGGDALSPETVTVNMGDPSIEYGSTYENFEAEITGVDQGGSSTTWLSAMFSTVAAPGTKVNLSTDGMRHNLQVSFLNLLTLADGQFTGTVKFAVTGQVKNGGARHFLYSKEYYVFLTVKDGNFVTPTNNYFSHKKGQPLPTPKSLTLNCSGSWTARCSKEIVMSAPNTVNNSTSSENIISGNGDKTISISLSNLVDASDYNGGSYSIAIETNTGTLLCNVTVYIVSPDGVSVSKAAYIFESIKQVTYPDPQPLSVVTDEAYTISQTSWIAIDVISGSLQDTFEGQIRVINPETFAAGTHQGNITLTGVSNTVTINITFNVVEKILTDIDFNEINFTKDDRPIRVTTGLENTFAQVQVHISFYDFKNNRTTSVFNLDIPFFQGVATFYPGQEIESFMAKILDLEDHFPGNITNHLNQFYSNYKPAEVVLNIFEKDYNDRETIINQYNLEKIFFAKGYRPENMVNNTAIVKASNQVRVTRNSIAFLNFIKRSGIHTIRIYRSGEEFKQIIHDPKSFSLFTLPINFFDFKEGDSIRVDIENGQGLTSKRYAVFPENKESFHLYWINSNEMLECFEFTGAFSFQNEYEMIQNEFYRNLVKVKENLETEREIKFSCNTGWVLKRNNHLIDDLVRSRKAWLILENTTNNIEVIPKASKLSGYDSDQELYDFEVEFTINPKSDAESYPY